MRRLKIIFVCKLTICLLTWSVLVAELDALRGSAVVLQARAKAEKKNSEPDEAAADENGDQVELNVTTTAKPVLTGIPQIDYVHDPNLPRELNGYNLSDYPFLNSVPEEIDFKCDGLHDGFYASVPHKCQLYHHCLFGTRFDFLCANYTAFDQKTFICHFVSQVDCPNSAKYFNRNEALYKTAETTTLSTTTMTTTSTTSTSTTPAPPPPPPPQPYYPQYYHQQPQAPYEGRRAMPPGLFAQGRKRRPAYRRRRPVYEYYYVDDYEDQQEYYDESAEQVPPVAHKKPIRKHSRLNNYKPVELVEVDYPESSSESDIPPSGNSKKNRGTTVHQQQHQQQQQQQQQQQHQQQQQRQQATVVTKNVSNQITSVYDKPRAPPKIRRPVPINERDRYDYASVSKPVEPAATVTTTSTTSTTTVAPPTKALAKGEEEHEPVEYYDDDEEDVPDNDDEYAAEPEAPATGVVKPAAVPKAEPVKPAKAAAAAIRTADYDTDRNRRPPAVVPAAPVVARPKGGGNNNNNRASASPPQWQPARNKPAADDYEDELPAAATRQSVAAAAAASKQRTSAPFLVRPQKPGKVRAPPPAVDDEDHDDNDPVVYRQPPQQPRQPQRVSVRQATAVVPQHRHRQPDHPAAANRRPVRPVYEYADEYYDE